MKNTIVDFDLSVTQWFDGDKFLSQIIREEIDTFKNEFDLVGEPVLSLLPDCRKYARKQFMNERALKTLSECIHQANGCIGESSLILECMGLFFWEEVEHQFGELLMDKMIKFLGEKSVQEIKEFLSKELIDLDGASYKRLALRSWERYYG